MKNKELPEGLHRDKKSGIIQMDFISCTRHIRKSTSTRSAEEAIAILQKAKADIWEEYNRYSVLLLEDLLNGKPTVSIDEILENIYEAKWKHTSQKRKPVQMVKYCAKLLGAHGEFRELRRTNSSTLLQLLMAEGKSAVTARKYISALMSTFKYANNTWNI